MNDALALAAIPILLVAAGAGVRALARREPEPLLESFASSAVLGLAACGVVGPLASLLGLAVVPVVWIALLALAAYGLVAIARSGARRPAFDAGDLAVVVAAAPPLIFVAYAALTRTALFGDEIYVWGYKSAVVSATGTIDPSTWTRAVERGPGYPLSLPVAGALGAILTGGFGFLCCRVVVILTYAAAVAALAEALRPYASRALRALAAFGLATLPVVLDEAPSFMADLAFTAAIAVAVARALRNPSARLTALHVAVLPLIKIEGIPIAALLAAVIALEAPRSDRVRSGAFALGLALLLALPWLLLYPVHGLRLLTAESPNDAARFGELRAVLADPRALLGRAVDAGIGVFSEFLPWVAHEGTPLGSFSQSLGPFGLLLPAVLLTAIVGSSEPPPVIPRRRVLWVALAVVAGQIVPIAVAPAFDWQMNAIRTRAALHVLPALLVLAFALRRERARAPLSP